MTDLHFPNGHRTFDRTRHRVCFLGYDRTIEVSFFVGVDVLRRISMQACNSEAEALGVFDGALRIIHKVAIRVYTFGGRGHGNFVYNLMADDF
jgi:hypothetical protein